METDEETRRRKTVLTCIQRTLLGIFVTSITTWYLATPYLVRPHPQFKKDMKGLIQSSASQQTDEEGGDRLENWTKWNLVLGKEGKVVEVRGHQTISLANMTLPLRVSVDWIVESEGWVGRSPEGGLEVTHSTPWYNSKGIFHHFTTEVEKQEGGGSVVRILPNFMFGASSQVLDKLYPEGPSNLPIVGMLTETTGGDRVLVQCYMNLVILSVVLLLWANNPPGREGSKQD